MSAGHALTTDPETGTVLIAGQVRAGPSEEELTQRTMLMRVQPL